MSATNATPAKANKDYDDDDELATTELARLSTTATEDDSTFVDYIAPPKPKVLPPPKYKAWIVVFVIVYLTSWAVALSGLQPWLVDTLRIAPRLAIFVQLCLIVSVLLYAGLDVVVFIVRFKIKGQWYGLGTWMSTSMRVRWVHEYANVLVETLAIAVTVLEDGFGMFNAAPSSSSSPSTESSSSSSNNKSHFECQNAQKHVILKIQYKVQSDQFEKYQAWRTELVRAMSIKSRPGLVSVDHTSTRKEEESETPTCLQTVHLTFESIDYLNEYMASPVRERMVRRLRPLLEHDTDLVQTVLQNAFADLARQQGTSSALGAAQPPKWKVWWITVLALYVTVLFLNATTPYYYDQWGLDTAHPRIESLVTTFFATFLSSYIFTPFLTMLFSHWSQAPSPSLVSREPWRTLDHGLQSITLKFMIVVAFYGALIGSWIARRK